MKVFVFTYDRYHSITTTSEMNALSIPHTVLCHSEEARQEYIKAGRVREENIISTNAPKGLGFNRNAALDLMADGEWAVFLVDDWERCYELDGYDSMPSDVIPMTKEDQFIWRMRFQKKISMNQFLRRCIEQAVIAEKMGFALCGFACNDNPFFRKKKYKTWALADGRAWVVKKTDLRFDTNIQTIDDYGWTVANLKRFGGVLVNDWILPECRRYTAGGYGSMRARMPQKIRDVRYLVNAYPEYVSVAKKCGWPDGSHIQIRPKRKTK